MQDMMRTEIVERRGRIEDLDRSFDLEFWREQTPQARFDAAWELVVHASKVKGLDVGHLSVLGPVDRFEG